LSVAYLLLKAVSYDGENLHADAGRPCAGHMLGFMSIGGRRYENNDIFLKLRKFIGLDFAAMMGRSTGWQWLGCGQGLCY